MQCNNLFKRNPIVWNTSCKEYDKKAAWYKCGGNYLMQHTWPDCTTTKIVLISEVSAFCHYFCNHSEVELWISCIIYVWSRSNWSHCACSSNTLHLSLATSYICRTLHANISASQHLPASRGLCWSTWSLCGIRTPLSSNVILPWGTKLCHNSQWPE